MIDLHRHDECSTFDGYGKPKELAVIAKELGYTSLGISNHGNSNSFVQHYFACHENGIKPVLGIEGYFLPAYKEQNRGYHLCLFAKNKLGYKHLNEIQFDGEKQKYYNSIWDFKILEKHSKGLICTSACIAGYLSQCIINGKIKSAKRFLKKMVDLFGEDFYVEIQPYKVTEKGVQEKINVASIKLAHVMGIKCILTSDSHRGRKEDYDTYLKLHSIAGHDTDWIYGTYYERYMPTQKEIMQRFVKMHAKDFGKEKAIAMAKEMMANLEEIEQKVDGDIFDQLELKLPNLENKNSTKLLIDKVKQGLKDRGKYTKKYIDRCKEELNVIKTQGFEDYFLIVADYVNWAKEQGISVGPGRGSVCNSEVAFALKITEVDSILFGLDFRRFLRLDKKKIPDIDLDFQTSRRHEVMEYLINKYKGHAARICSYGLYRIDNLVNDLAKTCGLETDKSLDEYVIKENAAVIVEIKSLIRTYMEGEELREAELLETNTAKAFNKKYDNIITHFTKLYKKVRYIGTHAAGVAITGGDLLQYCAIKIDKEGNYFTCFDLIDIEKINVIKFDLLGLKTMESINDLREITGDIVDYDEIIDDKKLLKQFQLGECDGVFQFEKKTARDILKKICCDTFDDVVAGSSMNRPGPLSLGMPDIYANNKYDEEARSSNYYQYTQDTYGTIIYQEQIMQICVYIGEMEWATADKIIKMMKSTSQKAEEAAEQAKLGQNLLKEFLSGALKKGFTKEEATDLFTKMTDSYSFNKGHGVGYSLISMEEMYYKVYHPTEYWYVKMKYANSEGEAYKFSTIAVKNDILVFLPHVNYTSFYSLRKIDGEKVIQQGLNSIKGIGDKAANFIEKERKAHGLFKDYDDFIERCKVKKSPVNKGVIEKLKEVGALEFNKKVYLERIKKYNSTLYMKGMSK